MNMNRAHHIIDNNDNSTKQVVSDLTDNSHFVSYDTISLLTTRCMDSALVANIKYTSCDKVIER
jgi:hypothetical protein